MIRNLYHRIIEWRARKRAPLDITQHPLLQPDGAGPRITTRALTPSERAKAATKLSRVDTAEKSGVR
jgi:hypothetical protein